MPRSFKVLLPARIRTPEAPEGGSGPLLSWVFPFPREKRQLSRGIPPSPVLVFSRGPWRSPGGPDETVGSQYGRTTPVPWNHVVALLRRQRPERPEEQFRRPNTR